MSRFCALGISLFLGVLGEVSALPAPGQPAKPPSDAVVGPSVLERTNANAEANVRTATKTPTGDAASRGYKMAERESEFPTVTFTDPEGRYLENVQVIAVNPVSIFYRGTDGVCCGEMRLAKLPENLQRLFGYDPLKAAKYKETNARGAATPRSPSSGRPEVLARYSGVSKSVANAPGSKESSNIAVLFELVSDYNRKHTYVGKQTGAGADIYVCGDMAMDVWNQIITKGLRAKIIVGNVKEDLVSVFDANHAWVLAETSPGLYLALEATGGFVKYASENPRYYFGHAFANPKELKEYMDLTRELQAAERKYNEAIGKYESSRSRSALDVVDVRTADVKEIRRKLTELLSPGN